MIRDHSLASLLGVVLACGNGKRLRWHGADNRAAAIHRRELGEAMMHGRRSWPHELRRRLFAFRPDPLATFLGWHIRGTLRMRLSLKGSATPLESASWASCFGRSCRRYLPSVVTPPAWF